MQCKDIPDEPVLRFLVEHGGIGCTVWAKDDGVPYDRSALRAMPSDVPSKLARAKMGMLIRRGLVDGCTCGCRGDYKLTAKGKQVIGVKMTKEEFCDQYCREHRLCSTDFEKYYVTVRCECADSECVGWKALVGARA